VIAYFDSSVVVSMLLGESTRDRCHEIWDRAHRVCGTRLLHIESAAVVHRAVREGRIGEFGHRRALQLLDGLWREFQIIELDESLMTLSAAAAGAEGLRGYDAVHCAAGLLLAAGNEAVTVSGDRKLLEAWSNNGAATIVISA